MVTTSTTPINEQTNYFNLLHLLFVVNAMDVHDEKVILVNAENPNEKLTYGEVRTKVILFATVLKDKFKLKVGETVAIYSPNDIYYFVVALAIIYNGGIPCAIDDSSSAKDAAKNLNKVQAKILITHVEIFGKALEAATRADIPKSNVLVLGHKNGGDVQSVVEMISEQEDMIPLNDRIFKPHEYTQKQIKEDPYFLLPTSGTTGEKKAVIVTQLMAIKSITLRDDKTMSSLKVISNTKFHNTSPLLTLLLTFRYGFTTYVIPHFDENIEKFYSIIQEEKINFVISQPYVLGALARMVETKKASLPSLVSCASTGATLDISVTREVKKHLGIPTANIWGMTEVFGIFNGTVVGDDPNCMGPLYAGFEAKIVDEDGNIVEDGKVGELLVKGPTVTPGYYNNSEATKAAFDSDDFFRTGDLFKVIDGQFYLIGRLKSLIKYKTGYIYPIDIETLLKGCSKVEECAVIGRIDPESKTEVPYAYISLILNEEDNPKLINDEIQVIIDNSPFKGILAFEIVSSFPRTSTGKINLLELQEKTKALSNK